ncbi:hypothetical protein CLOP_g23087 [Closterium sp. NIES-67]|nr:hypothetical protein CLOP_g23087 [Closterium sp. NIES-67]
MAPYVKQASLVISHAGSGSIFEALRASKPLVVVVNAALMDNHQRELAGALVERQHLVQATPASLAATVREMDLKGLVPYPPQEAEKYAQALDEFLGFS